MATELRNSFFPSIMEVGLSNQMFFFFPPPLSMKNYFDEPNFDIIQVANALVPLLQFNEQIKIKEIAISGLA